jgi:hypothetical protein
MDKSTTTTVQKETRKKPSFQERYEHEMELIRTIGYWNVNKADIARTLGVHRWTIDQDFKKILKIVSPHEAEELKFVCREGRKTIIGRLTMIINDPRAKNSDKVAAARVYSEIISNVEDKNRPQVQQNVNILQSVNFESILEEAKRIATESRGKRKLEIVDGAGASDS